MATAAITIPKRKRVLDFSIESLVGKSSDREEKRSRPNTPVSPAPAPRSPPSPVPDKDNKPEPTVRLGFQPVNSVAQFRLNALRKFHGFGNGLPDGATNLPPGIGHFGLPGANPFCFPPTAHGSFPTMLMGAHHRDLPPHLYPWIMARYPSILGPRLGGGDPTLLLQPFRKPKRIRTAFSPSQLLRLEHAFEKNHYVVGQERKDLAASLNLTETQVKVWFQNRRTKYKRMKAEEGDTNALAQVQMMEDELLLSDEEEIDDENSEISSKQNCKSSHHVDKWRAETSQIWENEES
ncbi:uncharacterized protein LOC141900853 [Tubulanus polymorphus]|uniref:uncharacterized protein LOC141900853 n=1 Tax=Tubulanus polymorphus TaxID=672921 RepID=UPI003DA29570